MHAILTKRVTKRIIVKIFKLIFFVLIAFSISYVLYGTLTKKEIQINKTELIKGQFKSIYESKSAKGTSISYNIEIENNSDVLKIIPEYAKCFKYKEFQKDAIINEEIVLQIDQNERFMFPNVKSIVSIKINSKEYLNIDCENESIQDSKKRIPAIIIAGILLVLIIKIVEKKYFRNF